MLLLLKGYIPLNTGIVSFLFLKLTLFLMEPRVHGHLICPPCGFNS